MSGEKSKVAMAVERTPEQAEARIEYLSTQAETMRKQHEATVGHLYGQIASLQKQHQDAMAAKVEAHNKDCHQRNEAYAAIQQRLMAAQDLICKLQDQLLKVRQVVNQSL
jgi:hypothetical protein